MDYLLHREMSIFINSIFMKMYLCECDAKGVTHVSYDVLISL